MDSALNVGIKEMHGKWFSPYDVMYPYTIETLIDTAKKYSNTIVYSNWDIINEKGNTLRNFHELNYNELSDFEYNIRLLDGQQIIVNTTLISLSLFKKCGIRELHDPVVVDYDFFLCTALICSIKFHLISKSLIKSRIHSNLYFT